MKTVTLTVKDRLNLLNYLPKQDSYDRLLMRKEIAKKIEISKEEASEIGLEGHATSTGGISYTWKEENAEPKEFELSEANVGYLKSILSKLSDEKKLSYELVDVYSEIV